MGWVLTIFVIATLIAFNMYVADMLNKMRADVQAIRRRVGIAGNKGDALTSASTSASLPPLRKKEDGGRQEDVDGGGISDSTATDRNKTGGDDDQATKASRLEQFMQRIEGRRIATRKDDDEDADDD